MTSNPPRSYSSEQLTTLAARCREEANTDDEYEPVMEAVAQILEARAGLRVLAADTVERLADAVDSLATLVEATFDETDNNANTAATDVVG